MNPLLRVLVRNAMYIAFVAMTIWFLAKCHGFGSAENLLNILNQNFSYFIVGGGMTLVIVSGGIDLSVGAVAAMCGVLATGVMMNGGAWLSEGDTATFLRLLPRGVAVGEGGAVGPAMTAGLCMGIAAGALVGCFNGWMITQFRIPPFIATLAWFTTARGLAYKFCHAQPIGSLPDEFTWLGQGQVGPTLFTVHRKAEDAVGQPQSLWFPILVAAAVVIVIHVVLTRTRFGRHLFAVGGNEEAARLSGLRVKANKIAVYTIVGLLAGLSGILSAARFQAGDPNIGKDPPLELGAITAVVLGGAGLNGGKGSMAGTLFGALFMGVLDNGLSLQGMQYFDQLIVKGIVLLVAVLFDQLKERV